MDEKDRLIKQLDESRAAMRALLDEIDKQAEIYPEWTIKQVLAHVAGWDDASTASLHAHAVGNEPGTPAVRGIDHYNAESVATREALDYDRIVREWELAREQFKQAITNMPPDKLAQEMILPWGGTGTIAQIVDIFAEHELEHVQEIKEMLKHG